MVDATIDLSSLLKNQGFESDINQYCVMLDSTKTFKEAVALAKKCKRKEFSDDI
jgi:hypothetical protein